MKFDLSLLKDSITWALPFSLDFKQKSFSKAEKKKLYYFIYGLFVFLGVLTGKYFEDMAEPFILAKLNEQKVFDVEVRTIEATLLPPRVTMIGLMIRDRGKKQELAKVDKAELAFDFSDLLRLKLSLHFDVNAYEGHLVGSAGTGTFFNTSEVVISTDCDGLEIGQIPSVERLKLALSGKVSFAAEIEGKLTNINSLEGEFIAHCEDLALKGVKPLFRIPRLSLGTVDIKASLSESLLRVKKISMNGEKISGDLAGDIRLNQSDLLKSKLDLKGRAKAELSIVNQRSILQKKAVSLMKAKKAVPVEISETVENPWVSFGD